MSRENLTSVEAEKAEADVRFKEEMARLHKKCNSCRLPKATVKSPGKVLHKELAVVTSQFSELKLENATLQEE